MLSLGAHMSTAGGAYQAVVRGAEVGCDCVQLFTKNNNQWQAKPLTPQDLELFAKSLRDTKIKYPIAHASYLINLAAPDDLLWKKSIGALVIEWQRAEAFHLDGLVVHPGSFTTTDAETGIRRVAEGVKQVIEQVGDVRCRLLLENTAGQGSNLGADLSELGFVFRQLDWHKLLGACIDTCHAMAAGYDMSVASGQKKLLKDIEEQVRLENVVAIHLNDSKKGCGSRVDRHEHLGLGTIGEDGFRTFLRTTSLHKIPMYLETPKGTDEESGEDWDVINLRAARKFAKKTS